MLHVTAHHFLYIKAVLDYLNAQTEMTAQFICHC